ncbi:MAG TPA: SDR family oxidoreductase [Spirochaetota bacterium]|nr:SDR family oxidoreductase [Spirochaetota bacterium]
MKNVALITGSAKRIGKHIAITMAKEGYDIAIHYFNSEYDASDTKNEIKKIGVNCEIFKCDLSDENETSALIKNVKSIFPDLNTLINSASIFQKSKLTETTNSLFDSTININLKAPFILTRDFAKLIKKGNIINLIDAKISNNNFSYSAYSLSKKGLLELTYLSAKELAPDIRVNGIAPGLILPPDGEDYTYMDELSKKMPLKSVGNVQNISDGIKFLLNNDYITGQVIFIDGGFHL